MVPVFADPDPGAVPLEDIVLSEAKAIETAKRINGALDAVSARVMACVEKNNGDTAGGYLRNAGKVSVQRRIRCIHRGVLRCNGQLPSMEHSQCVLPGERGCSWSYSWCFEYQRSLW